MNVPLDNFLSIRSLINGLAEMIELCGYNTPVILIRNLVEYISRSWPADIPRDDNNEIFLPSDENIVEIFLYFGPLMDKGLKVRKDFITFNRFFTRRNKIDNFQKLSALMTTLAEELGPIAHGFCSHLVDKIDLLTDHHFYQIRSRATWINEYKNDIELWMSAMYKTPEIFKINKGKLVKTTNSLGGISEHIRVFYISKAEERSLEMPDSSRSGSDFEDHSDSTRDENNNYMEQSTLSDDE